MELITPTNIIFLATSLTFLFVFGFVEGKWKLGIITAVIFLTSIIFGGIVFNYIIRLIS